MQRDTDIIGWFYRNGKRIPIRKGKGHAKTKSGWDKPESEYSGAEDNYQHLYKGGKRSGSVVGWSSDGDYGYNARDKDRKYLGNYNTREKAQKAVEKVNSKGRNKRKSSQEYSKKEWDSFTNKKKLSIIEEESKRNKKKGIRGLERREPE